MLDPLTSPLIAGVLGDTLAVVFVHLVAHQVLQVSAHVCLIPWSAVRSGVGMSTRARTGRLCDIA